MSLPALFLCPVGLVASLDQKLQLFQHDPPHMTLFYKVLITCSPLDMLTVLLAPEYCTVLWFFFSLNPAYTFVNIIFIKLQTDYAI